MLRITYDDLLSQSNKEIPYSDTYNSDWVNHPNSSWSGNNNVQPPQAM